MRHIPCACVTGQSPSQENVKKLAVTGTVFELFVGMFYQVKSDIGSRVGESCGMLFSIGMAILAFHKKGVALP